MKQYIPIGSRTAVVLLTFIWVIFSVSTVHADSPPNITDDIPWSASGAGYSNSSDIETAFNYARRQEEIQLGLAANTIGTLDLPANWDSMTDDAKALYIINDERQDRAGMKEGVIGLPLTEVPNTATLPELDDLAQYYADYLLAHSAFGHHEDGQWPYERIDHWPVIDNCHEFLARSENLFIAKQSVGEIPLPVERAIYNWIYNDSGSSWGHREAVLLQDKTVSGEGSPYGYDNNAGSSSDEGYLGIGVAKGAYGTWKSAAIVVMNIIDPKSTDCSTEDGKYDFSDAQGYGIAYYDDSGPYFGSGRTIEDTPLPADDNDGIVRTPGIKWTPGGTGSVDITIGGASGYLTAWIDWDDDGELEAEEKIIDNVSLPTGTTTLTINVPASPTCFGSSNDCYARFRLSDQSEPDITPMGAGSPGEVNDYAWQFGPNPVTLKSVSSRASVTPSLLWAIGALLTSLGVAELIILYDARKRRKQQSL